MRVFALAVLLAGCAAEELDCQSLRAKLDDEIATNSGCLTDQDCVVVKTVGPAPYDCFAHVNLSGASEVKSLVDKLHQQKCWGTYEPVSCSQMPAPTCSCVHLAGYFEPCQSKVMCGQR